VPRPIPLPRFAQLTYRETCATSRRASGPATEALPHGDPGPVARSTWPIANERDWPDYAAPQVLIGLAKPLYATEPLGGPSRDRLCPGLDESTLSGASSVGPVPPPPGAIKLHSCSPPEASRVHLHLRSTHACTALDLCSPCQGHYVLDALPGFAGVSLSTGRRVLRDRGKRNLSSSGVTPTV